MNEYSPAPGALKRKRGRPSHKQPTHIVLERAVAFGVKVPVLPETNENFLSPDEISEILNISVLAVKQLIYRRKFPAVKIANGYWKIRVRDFESYLQARTKIGCRHILITNCGGGSDIQPITDTIAALGYQAVFSQNYSDALMKAVDQLPSLFIICISPNDPDCWKFAERLRKHKALRNLPILFIGGTTISDEETDSAIRCSAQGILTRPFHVDLLKKEIERILIRAM